MSSIETRERMRAIVREACDEGALYSYKEINGTALKIDNRNYDAELEQIRKNIIEKQVAKPTADFSTPVEQKDFNNNTSGYISLKTTLERKWMNYMRFKNSLSGEKEQEREVAAENFAVLFGKTDNGREL